MRTFLIHKQKPFQTMTLKERLCHHVTGAIEQGEAEAIAEMPAQIEILAGDRSEYNESNGKGMAGCIAKAGSVIAYFPTQSAFKSAPIFASAPDMFDALQGVVDYLETFACHDEQGRIALSKAQETIARAKGESK